MSGRYHYDKLRYHWDFMGQPTYEYIVKDREDSSFSSRSFNEETARRITETMNAHKQSAKNAQAKIITIDKLVHARKFFHQFNQKVVFTNGCFRVIHAGHAWLLDWAKQQGDILIVAVNSDESVYRIRGNGLCYPLAERMTILSALEAVDYVVSFDEDTPYELIDALKPDVMVKGPECATTYIPGSDIVSDVRIAPEGPYMDRHATKILEAL